MRMPNPKYYKCDEDGQWWYHHARGGRVRAKNKVCEGCGTPYVIDPFHAGRSRFCSRQCACRNTGMASYPGDKHPGWKGGRIRRKNGYVAVYAPNHPSLTASKKRHVLEHRLVMEQKLGRYLQPFEEVHHINGVKDDNRPENLELWVRSHPAGVRADDACPHCGGTGVALKITVA